MNAIVEHTGPVVQLVPKTNAPEENVMNMIATMLDRPDSDIDKLERLMGMQKEMREESRVQAYNTAMALAQQEMPVIVAQAENKQTKSTYADLATIFAQAVPIITAHGFSFSAMPCESDIPDHVGVKWEVSHSGGHVKTGTADVPVDDKGPNGTKNKTGVHAFGSSATYARRYIFCMLFNIAIGKDDDGNAGGARPDPVISADQFVLVRDLADEMGIDHDVICKDAKVTDLHQLTVKAFTYVMNKLAKTKAERAEAAKNADQKPITADLGGDNA